MKKILFSALMACFALTASAQISEGAPSAKKYATGNRPTKGTFGLYVGAESDLFDRVTDRFAFNPLPIVNLKYMVSDNFELRLGMKFWKQRESLHFGNDKGDVNAYDEKYNAKAVVAEAVNLLSLVAKCFDGELGILDLLLEIVGHILSDIVSWHCPYCLVSNGRRCSWGSGGRAL